MQEKKHVKCLGRCNKLNAADLVFENENQLMWTKESLAVKAQGFYLDSYSEGEDRHNTFENNISPFSKHHRLVHNARFRKFKALYFSLNMVSSTEIS